MADLSGCDLAALYANSIKFKAVLLYQVLVCTLTTVLCCIGIKKFRFSYFHPNCKVLIISLYSCYIVCACSLAVTQFYHFITYNLFSPCDILVSTLTCHLIRGYSNVSMTVCSFIHLFISVERLVAKYYVHTNRVIGKGWGVGSVILAIVLSTLWYVYVMRNDNLSYMTPYCSPVNKYTMSDASSYHLYLMIFDLISLLIFMGLHCWEMNEHKKLVKPKVFNLRAKFSRIEHRQSTKILLPLTAVHCVLYVSFEIANILLLSYTQHMDYMTFRTLFAAVNVTCPYTVISSILFIHLLNKHKRKHLDSLRFTTRKITDQEEIKKAYMVGW